MKKSNNIKFNQRIVAAFLAVLMVFSLLPSPSITAVAETDTVTETGAEEETEGVKITVVDENETPISEATVEYTICYYKGDEQIEVKSNTGDTDEDGRLEILNFKEYQENSEKELYISANVSMDGYRYPIQEDISIKSTKENKVKIRVNDYPEVVIEVNKSTYDGNSKNLLNVTLNGNSDNSTIYYSEDGENWSYYDYQNTPQIENVGIYPVYVKVERDGHCYYKSEELIATIEKADMGVVFVPYEDDYDEESHNIFKSIEGIEKGDIITYTYGERTYKHTYNGGNVFELFPEITEVGKYNIVVDVNRNDNYKKIENVEYIAEIKYAEIADIKVSLRENLIYSGKNQELVDCIEGIKENDKVEFCFLTQEDEEKKWNEAHLEKVEKGYRIKNLIAREAGEYTVDFRVERADKNYYPPTIELPPCKVTIDKAYQSLNITKNELPEELTSDHIGKTFKFNVSSDSIENPEIIYYIKKDSEEDTDGNDIKIEDIAEIDSITGEVIINGSGCSVKVVATVEGNENYKETALEYRLVIRSSGELIEFKNKEIEYVFGTNQNKISDQKVVNKKNNHSSLRGVTYSAKIEGSDYDIDSIGIKLIGKGPDKGKIYVDNMDSLSKGIAESLEKYGEPLVIIVTANKPDGIFSKSDQDSYSIKITTEPLPEGDAYTMHNPDGENITEANGENDWYNTAVTIMPAEGYLIAKDSASNYFSEKVKYDDHGDAKRVIYLKNATTGGITEKITFSIDIDSEAPDANRINIEYSEPKSKIESWIENIFYYNSDATITFTAYDYTSGVDTFNWEYTRSDDASTSNLELDKGVLTAKKDDSEHGKYTATLTLPRKEVDQLKGRLSVTATDKAGNKSDIKTDEDNIIVVDSISPELSVTYKFKDGENYQEVEPADGDATHYCSKDAEIIFTIDEANFFGDDVDISIVKDGVKRDVQDLTWNKVSGEDQTEDLYESTITLSEEGTYSVNMKYTDRSGNMMEEYNSETIVIDKTAPKIEFSYANHRDNENPQSATITIEEKNFNKEDIELITVAKDIAGNEVKVNDLEEYLRTCEWTENGDRHTATISSQFVDAIYDLTINYKDLACNEADEVKPPTFIIDHVAPATSNMSVTYSTPLMKKILSKITFGYYNPSVNVTFTAHDDISGVDYFDWTYNRENGVSTSNKATYAEEKLIAVQDSKDKTKFTASITLPKNKAEQLRGNVTFKATDKSNNVSEKITDTNNVIVVDTIAPTMTVEYSDPSNTVGRKMYYNKAMTATFAVTEANFYSEDVIVELSKDGVSPIRIKPSWVDVSTDLHIGTYTIPAPSDHSKDGDYVISVKYKDRSNNQMKTYTSNTLVIDTTNPVISVLYADNSPINTMVDSEGNQRKYFSNTQTATVSIKERNFNANDMKYSIVAKDVEGNILNNNSLYRMSSWESKGDVHTMTITYPGDANYTFDLAYTDLAANEAADYRPDYFTVDTTKPTNHTVSYSTSLLDTILSNITFGFYDAKVRVTLSATDNTSKVNSFKYSYVNAAGVSSSNSELIDQIIEESGIRYSNGGRTATTTFDIPKGLLGSNNQFNGTVNFDATDRSGNISDQSQETKRIVVDNISPTANVEYNTPVQTIGGVSYYDGDITPRVTINEANFYPEDVIISVTRDGQAYPVSPSWTDNSADVHVGSFTLSGDGDYLISVSYTDKSNNFMEEYTSEQLTIDTEINEPVLTINGEEADGKAFKDDILLEFSFEDINFESYEITLLRTNYGNKNVNVTDEFIDDHVKVSETGVSARVDSFDKIAENDGIYNIKVSFTDKAGHYAEKSAKFTVNRYGSVYEYNDYLISLIADGGAYTQKVDEDLVITEYNADRLLSQSLNIEVLRDGKPIDNPAIEVSPEIDNQVSAGNSGWYQYQYTINKSNFSGDGVYKIIVSSEDATGNNPENTNYDDKSIVFHVDSTPPEINSITGLDNNIINQANVDVNYTVYDAIGLASVEVYVDGKEINKITDFSSDLNNYSGSFTLSESSSEQKVRLLVTDLAGNVTDTSKEDFTSAYVFNDSVLISTNTFVRWTANKPVFWGSIAGAAGTVAIGTAGTVFFRRKKRIKK